MAEQTYRITHPETGQTIKMTGAKPPTEAEIRLAFAAVKQPESQSTPQPASPAAQPEQGLLSKVGGFGLDVLKGGAKGAANTVIGLGELAHQYLPGVGRLSNAIHGGDQSSAFDATRQGVQPTNTAQKIGFGLEQIGEFFVPAAKVAQVARGSRVARAALDATTAAPLALAQGATGGEAGITGALSAAVPGASAAVGGARSLLRRSAEKNITQALGATKEWAKDESAKLAPGILARGIGGSREAMLATAKSSMDDIGKKIGAEVQKASAAGKTIDGQAIAGYIATSRQTLKVPSKNGGLIPIVGYEGAIRQLDRLEAFVEKLGPNIPFDRAQKIKVAWDKVVSKAGLYGPKSTASAADNAAAWSIREANDGFRRLLAQGSATLDDLNAEYAFWKGLKGVLKETTKRTQAQGGGLVSGITGATGMGAGFASGGDTSDKIQNAVLGGVAGRQLVRVMQSPWWRSKVAAPLKNKLASALAAGDSNGALEVLARITATMPTTGRLSPTR